MSDKKQFTELEIQAGLEIAHKEYFTQVVALLSMMPNAKDLTYVKVPMTTPEGGNYLVSILHIDGPTIDLKKLDEAAKKVEDGPQ